MSTIRRRIMESRKESTPQRILLLSQDFIETDINGSISFGDYWDNVSGKVYTYEFEYEITNNVGTNNSLRATGAMTSFTTFSQNIARTSVVKTFTAIGSTRRGRAFAGRIGSSSNSYHVKIWNLKIYQEPN